MGDAPAFETKEIGGPSFHCREVLTKQEKLRPLRSRGSSAWKSFRATSLEREGDGDAVGVRPARIRAAFHGLTTETGASPVQNTIISCESPAPGTNIGSH